MPGHDAMVNVLEQEPMKYFCPKVPWKLLEVSSRPQLAGQALSGVIPERRLLWHFQCFLGLKIPVAAGPQIARLHRNRRVSGIFYRFFSGASGFQLARDQIDQGRIAGLESPGIS
jgi:hypothetical protein